MSTTTQTFDDKGHEVERSTSVAQITEDLEYITGWLGYCEDSDFGLSKLQVLANTTGNLKARFAKEFERIGL
jgi:hypothetical protein